MESIGFSGAERFKDPIEKYIGQAVVIHAGSGSISYSGRIVRIEDGWLILNPHFAGHYDPDNGLVRHLVKEDAIIRADTILSIEPTTLTHLQAYADYSNTHKDKKDKDDVSKAEDKQSSQ